MDGRVTHRAGLLALPVAVLVGHELGYRLTGGGHQAVDHGYLSALVKIAVLAGLTAVVVRAMSADTGRRTGVRLQRLVAAQIIAFVAMEFVEHMAAGAGVKGLVTSAAVWLGLVAQLGTAVVAHLGLGRIAGIRPLRTTSLVRLGPTPERTWMGPGVLSRAPLGAPRAGAGFLAALRGPPPATP